MSSPAYRAAPDPEESGWPKGIPYIIGNEGCERFSFYGMKSILQVHLTALYAATGLLERQSEEAAQAAVHLFIAGVYALPMIGAVIADRFLGKYRTIMFLSLVYCAGHAVLAIGEESLPGMYLGLGLIAVGSGGIKPCVSAHVGDQFGKGNWRLVEKVFQAFYFIINFGSFFATLLIPWLRERYGTSVAFGVPGVLMFLATAWFWAGRKVFVHVPARPGGRLGLLDAASSGALFMTFGSLFFTGDQPWWVSLPVAAGFLALGLGLFTLRQRIAADDGFLAVFLYALGRRLRGGGERAGVAEAGSVSVAAPAPGAALADHWFWGPAARRFGGEATEGPQAVLRIISVFFLVSVFWALFDQHASSWIRQAQRMDRTFELPLIGALTVLPSQVQSLNPLLVMILIPALSFGLYPGLRRVGIELTPLRRMTIGMFIASLSFVAVALIQARMDEVEGTGVQVHVAWQFIPYIVITIAEVMVSITGLEFAYTQAPRRMKSTIMGFWLLSVALGNVLVAALSKLPDMTLQRFFWTFAVLMAAAGLLFGVRAAFYRPRDYTQ